METALDSFLKSEYRKYSDLRLGVLSIPCSVNVDLIHINSLVTQKKLGLNVTCLFGAQHGIRGEKQDDMKESDDCIDIETKLPVYSLYGETREPLPAHLENIDAFLVDIFDPGCRIYTFVYTLANCMRAAKANNKKVIVLDRPNPINGNLLEGNCLETDFTSFVGQYPVITRHGMTPGELALLFNDVFEIGCDLEVIKCPQWNRDSFADDYTSHWISPSLNLPQFNSVLTFPGCVHFEGTNISEGRGTTRPFEQIGAPFIDPFLLAREMNAMKIEGTYFRPIYFEPTYQKHAFKVCGGVHIHVTDKNVFPSFKVGIRLLAKIAELYPNDFEWKKPPYEYETTKMPIDIIAGTAQLREHIDKGINIENFEKRAQTDTEAFHNLRSSYLIY